ncbi:MAG: erythromycin esterase family protein [Acidobacteriota bacterium]
MIPRLPSPWTLLLLLPQLLGAAPQPDPARVASLKKTAIPVRSIDPEDADFTDLLPLRRLIGQARIVGLGEQSHGDGATLRAKVRLVRFLHEKMGFNLLAWESGLYDCEQMDRALRSDVPIEQASATGVFRVWSRSGQVRPLFEYVRSTHGTKRPLRMTGFDMQISSPRTYATFARHLFEFLDRFDAGALSSESRGSVQELLLALPRVEKYQPVPEQRQRYRAAVERGIEGLALSPRRGALPREEAFWNRALRNLLIREEQIRGLFEEGKFKNSPALGNLRDRTMAEILLWLAREYYPKEKIILWAASFHLVRNQAAIDTRTLSIDYKATETMGNLVWKALGERMYTIAFTAFQGKAGASSTTPWTRELQTPPEDSLEAVWYATGATYAYLDLRKLPKDHWLRKPVLSGPLGYSLMSAAWPDHFDAVFYTDTMVPNTQDASGPQAVERTKPQAQPAPHPHRIMLASPSP